MLYNRGEEVLSFGDSILAKFPSLPHCRDFRFDGYTTLGVGGGAPLALFPRCACCGRVKFRTYFRYFAPVTMRLTRKGDICLCRDCCLKYNIRSISDFRKRSEIKKRMEYKSKYL